MPAPARLRRLGAPRFDLRVRRGHCRMRLRAPIAAGPGRVERLETEVDIGGPLDLSGGALRFRGRRSRLVEAELRVRIASAFSALGDASGVELASDGVAGDQLRVSVPATELEGPLSLALRPIADGPDLLFLVEDLRWVREGGRSPWVRVRELAKEVGLKLDVDRGGFRWRRPLRRLLAEALLPHGWRVPDERSGTLALSLMGDGNALFEVGGAEAAKVTVDLSLPRRRIAATENADLARQIGGWVLALHTGPIGPAARIAYAADDGDEPGLRDALRSLEDEPSACLRAEALLAAAESAFDRDSASACGRYVLGALALAPRRAGLWARWCERFAERGWPEALRLADVALAGPLPRHTRARLAGTAIESVRELHDASLDVEDERRIQRLLEAARALGPEVPEVLAAMASDARARGELEEAIRLWTRAADAAPDQAGRGYYRRSAAELAFGLEGPEASEPLFERALTELGGEDPSIVARLAQIAALRGEWARADELFGSLLQRPPEDDEHLDALLVAARHYVEAGTPDRAKAYLVAMGPSLDAVMYEDLECTQDGVSEQVAGLEDVDLEALQRDLSQALGHPPGRLTEPFGADSGGDNPGDERPLRAGRDMLSSVPPVTLVHVADDEVRALLDEANAVDDPVALLEGALEEAMEDEDAASVARVLGVLDRLEPFAGERALRERASRVLARLEEEES